MFFALPSSFDPPHPRTENGGESVAVCFASFTELFFCRDTAQRICTSLFSGTSTDLESPGGPHAGHFFLARSEKGKLFQDYLAPEMILATGHGVALDWWTFGISMLPGKQTCASVIKALKGTQVRWLHSGNLPGLRRFWADSNLNNLASAWDSWRVNSGSNSCQANRPLNPPTPCRSTCASSKV